MIIESLSNSLIKHACSLKEKKFRTESGEFLAEGVRLVLDINLFAPDSIINIFVTETVFAVNKELPADKVCLVSDLVMNKLSDTQTSQGVVAVVKKRENVQIKNDRILFLDRIRDPGNLGAIIRTAAAAGYSLILNNCTDPYSQKVVRSCMGGIFKADFVESDETALIDLKMKDYKITAAGLDGQKLFGAVKHTKICIVIGSEADGISDNILALCDEVVTIPMVNIESLNAAVSAGIIMYYYTDTVSG